MAHLSSKSKINESEDKTHGIESGTTGSYNLAPVQCKNDVIDSTYRPEHYNRCDLSKPVINPTQNEKATVLKSTSIDGLISRLVGNGVGSVCNLRVIVESESEDEDEQTIDLGEHPISSICHQSPLVTTSQNEIKSEPDVPCVDRSFNNVDQSEGSMILNDLRYNLSDSNNLLSNCDGVVGDKGRSNTAMIDEEVKIAARNEISSSTCVSAEISVMSDTRGTVNSQIFSDKNDLLACNTGVSPVKRHAATDCCGTPPCKSVRSHMTVEHSVEDLVEIKNEPVSDNEGENSTTDNIHSKASQSPVPSHFNNSCYSIPPNFDKFICDSTTAACATAIPELDANQIKVKNEPESNHESETSNILHSAYPDEFSHTTPRSPFKNDDHRNSSVPSSTNVMLPDTSSLLPFITTGPYENDMLPVTSGMVFPTRVTPEPECIIHGGFSKSSDNIELLPVEIKEETTTNNIEHPIETWNHLNDQQELLENHAVTSPSFPQINQPSDKFRGMNFDLQNSVTTNSLNGLIAAKIGVNFNDTVTSKIQINEQYLAEDRYCVENIIKCREELRSIDEQVKTMGYDSEDDLKDAYFCMSKKKIEEKLKKFVRRRGALRRQFFGNRTEQVRGPQKKGYKNNSKTVTDNSVAVEQEIIKNIRPCYVLLERISIPSYLLDESADINDRKGNNECLEENSADLLLKKHPDQQSNGLCDVSCSKQSNEDSSDSSDSSDSDSDSSSSCSRSSCSSCNHSSSSSSSEEEDEETDAKMETSENNELVNKDEPICERVQTSSTQDKLMDPELPTRTPTDLITSEATDNVPSSTPASDNPTSTLPDDDSDIPVTVIHNDSMEADINVEEFNKSENVVKSDQDKETLEAIQFILDMDNSNGKELETVEPRPFENGPEEEPTTGPEEEPITDILSNTEQPKNTTLFKCNSCPRKFKTLRGLLAHSKMHCQKYFCHKCHSKHKNSQEFSKHRCENKDASPYCSKCNKKFDTNAQYSNHMKVHQVLSTLKFVCKDCNKCYSTKNGIIKHFDIAHMDIYSCDVCDAKYTDFSKLKVHIRYKHPTPRVNYDYQSLSNTIHQKSPVVTKPHESPPSKELSPATNVNESDKEKFLMTNAARVQTLLQEDVLDLCCTNCKQWFGVFKNQLLSSNRKMSKCPSCNYAFFLKPIMETVIKHLDDGIDFKKYVVVEEEGYFNNAPCEIPAVLPTLNRTSNDQLTCEPTSNGETVESNQSALAQMNRFIKDVSTNEEIKNVPKLLNYKETLWKMCFRKNFIKKSVKRNGSISRKFQNKRTFKISESGCREGKYVLLEPYMESFKVDGVTVNGTDKEIMIPQSRPEDGSGIPLVDLTENSSDDCQTEEHSTSDEIRTDQLVPRKKKKLLVESPSQCPYCGIIIPNTYLFGMHMEMYHDGRKEGCEPEMGDDYSASEITLDQDRGNSDSELTLEERGDSYHIMNLEKSGADIVPTLGFYQHKNPTEFREITENVEGESSQTFTIQELNMNGVDYEWIDSNNYMVVTTDEVNNSEELPDDYDPVKELLVFHKNDPLVESIQSRFRKIYPKDKLSSNEDSTKQRLFECEICTKSFYQKGNLKLHMLLNHECQLCYNVFDNVLQVKEHLQKEHVRENPNVMKSAVTVDENCSGTDVPQSQDKEMIFPDDLQKSIVTTLPDEEEMESESLKRVPLILRKRTTKITKVPQPVINMRRSSCGSPERNGSECLSTETNEISSLPIFNDNSACANKELPAISLDLDEDVPLINLIDKKLRNSVRKARNKKVNKSQNEEHFNKTKRRSRKIRRKYRCSEDESEQVKKKSRSHRSSDSSSEGEEWKPYFVKSTFSKRKKTDTSSEDTTLRRSQRFQISKDRDNVKNKSGSSSDNFSDDNSDKSIVDNHINIESSKRLVVQLVKVLQ